MWKAKHLKCLLLTGDAKLRNEATEQGITVHGSLWVIQQMVVSKVVTVTAGIEFLEKLKAGNDRLPFGEIEKLMKKLKS